MRTIIRDNYDPQLGDYHERIVVDEARQKSWLFDCDGVFLPYNDVEVANEKGESTTKAVSQKLFTDEINRLDAEDTSIWNEIENIEAASDVVDVVGTYAELQQYDTSKLHDNDLIKVLQDETHDNEIAYYRWNDTTEVFSYVGAEGPYYTQSQIDTMMSGKQDTLIAGTNIQIAADGKTISATDTTYTHFTGATASTDGVQGLVPGPLAGDEDKFLKGDGTWADASYNVFTNNVDGLTPAPHNSYPFRQYLLDNATWAIQIAEYAPSIASNGTDLTVTYKTSNGMNEGTIKTYSNLAMTGATSSANGKIGFVPQPLIADKDKFLKGDGTWGTVATTTIFYADDITAGQSTELYSDSGYTTQITYGDLIDALASGPVGIFWDNSVYYVVNYYVAVDPDWGAGYYIIEFYVQSTTYAGWNFSKLAVQRATNVSLSTSDVSYTPPTANASTAGIAKLYTTTGQNTDGAVTQKLFTDTVGNVEAALQILNSGAGVP